MIITTVVAIDDDGGGSGDHGGSCSDGDGGGSDNHSGDGNELIEIVQKVIIETFIDFFFFG